MELYRFIYVYICKNEGPISVKTYSPGGAKAITVDAAAIQIIIMSLNCKKKIGWLYFFRISHLHYVSFSNEKIDHLSNMLCCVPTTSAAKPKNWSFLKI